MRLRTLIGFGIGYALGARSGTQKLDNLAGLAQNVKESPIFKAMLEQAKQAAASGMESLTGQKPAWAESGDGQQAQTQRTPQGGQPAHEGEQASQEGESSPEEGEQAEASGDGEEQPAQETSSGQSSGG